jgi:hypothetical protein
MTKLKRKIKKMNLKTAKILRMRRNKKIMKVRKNLKINRKINLKMIKKKRKMLMMNNNNKLKKMLKKKKKMKNKMMIKINLNKWFNNLLNSLKKATKDLQQMYLMPLIKIKKPKNK